MSRGFDGFNLDDFRDSDWGSGLENESYTLESFGFGREIGRGSSSDPSARLRLQKLRDAESASDRAVIPEHRRKDVHSNRIEPDSPAEAGSHERHDPRYGDSDTVPHAVSHQGHRARTGESGKATTSIACSRGASSGRTPAYLRGSGAVCPSASKNRKAHRSHRRTTWAFSLRALVLLRI